MAKRAPGHWMCYGLPGKHDWGVGNSSIEICDGLSEANARFIAAGPDTVEALAECLPILESMIIRDASEAGDDMSQEETAMLERAHAALARAEGVD